MVSTRNIYLRKRKQYRLLRFVSLILFGKHVWDALERGEIVAYDPEDDEFKRPPLDFEALKAKYFRTDTSGYTDEDEDGNEIWVETFVERKLESEDVHQILLKEYWYINKQDTRQNVRIVGLAFVYNECRDRDGEMECNPITLFWIPMNDMRVRNVLVKHDAYDEFNQASPRSYDDIFIQRYFESFITRETNDYNRSISDYLTGEDALIESENIEERIDKPSTNGKYPKILGLFCIGNYTAKSICCMVPLIPFS